MSADKAASRASELDAKRKKLAELRARRAQRQQQKDKEAKAQQPPTTAQNGEATPAAPSGAQKLLESVAELTLQDSPSKPEVNGTQPQQSSASTSQSSSSSSHVGRKKVQLSTHQFHNFNIAPRVVETYAKGTAIEPDQAQQWCAEQFGLVQKKDVVVESRVGGDGAPSATLAAADAECPNSASDSEDANPVDEPELCPDAALPDILSESEFAAVAASADFQRSFAKTSLFMERALSHADNAPDIFADYAGQLRDADNSSSASQQCLRKRCVFSSSVSRHRPVTAVHWSPHFAELCLASHSSVDLDGPNISEASEAGSGDQAEGLVMIWSTLLTNRPEYRFECQSKVLSARFHPHNAQVVLGGTFSGQIVLWDTRDAAKNNHSPVTQAAARSSFSHGHTQPVYSVVVAPTAQTRHAVFTMSNNGQVCRWNDELLVEPTQDVELGDVDDPFGHNGKAVSSSCMAMSQTGVAVLGSEDGLLYKAHVLEEQDHLQGSFSAHSGPITSVAFHPPVRGGSDMTSLFLSTSYDWTIRLWHLQDAKFTLDSQDEESSHRNAPLLTLEHSADYVHEAAWSPCHPAVFASVDGLGRLSLWNLNEDIQVPVECIQVTEPKSASQPVACSCLAWSRDGKQIAVGDSTGEVHVFDVLRHSEPADYHDEATAFHRTLKSLTSTQA